jgi:hypothetical protein
MSRALRHALSPRKVALLIALAAVTGGCSLNTDVSLPGGGLIKFSGDLQSAPTNTPLPTDLAVMVVTQFGEPLQNVTVTWTIASGGGTLSATSTVTDENGIAAVSYTTGTTAGPVVIEARVSGVPPLSFNITVT